MSKKKKCNNYDCENLTNGNLCKPCDLIRRSDRKNPNYRRYWHTNKKYGIDEMGFEILWVAFKGKCGICGIDLKLPSNTRGQQLDTVVIDHSHKTKNLRGLLCNGCNKGIGLLKENVSILKNAINYLEMCNEKNGKHS